MAGLRMFALWFVPLGLVAADTEEIHYPSLQWIDWKEEITEVASRFDVAVRKREFVQTRATLQLGDTVTGLVAFEDEGETTQWLVELVAQTGSTSPSTPVIETSPPMRIYSITGTALEFSDEKINLAVRVIGPIDATDLTGVAEKRVELSVNRDLLAVGLDRACEGWTLMRERVTADPQLAKFKYRSRTSKPFDARIVEAAQPLVTALGLTPELEHGMIGAQPMLMEFWKLVAHIPEVRDCLPAVVSPPSRWSVWRNRGGVEPTVKMHPQFAQPIKLKWGPETTKQEAAFGFTALLQLNGQPAMACALVAMASRPPIQATGGIVWLAAQRPDGTGPRLTFQVLATSFSAP